MLLVVACAPWTSRRRRDGLRLRFRARRTTSPADTHAGCGSREPARNVPGVMMRRLVRARRDHEGSPRSMTVEGLMLARRKYAAAHRSTPRRRAQPCMLVTAAAGDLAWYALTSATSGRPSAGPADRPDARRHRDLLGDEEACASGADRPLPFAWMAKTIVLRPLPCRAEESPSRSHAMGAVRHCATVTERRRAAR